MNIKITPKNFRIPGVITAFFAGIFCVNAQINVYDFTQYNETYTEITGGTILATATANTTGANAAGNASIDDTVFIMPAGTIPFTFKYDNVTYTSFYISSNGFITFGAAPLRTGSTTGYTPISAATVYAGAVSAFGRDLNSYWISGNPAQTGELRMQLTGVAPTRKLVIQFKNFRPKSTGAVFGQVLNFQIRLCEQNSNVEIGYGSCPLTSINSAQVGLRGPSPAVFANRSAAPPTLWTATVAGSVASATVGYNNTGVSPTNGLVFRYGPPLCPPPANISATNITQTQAQLTWSSTGGTGTYTVEYGDSGFVAGTGTVISGIVGTSVIIGGLIPLHAYQYFVYQNCGVDGNSIIPARYKFHTGTLGEDCITAPFMSVASSEGACVGTVITSGYSQNGPNSQCSDVTGNLPNDDSWVKIIVPSNNNKLVFKATATGLIDDWVMEVWKNCPGSGGTVLDCGDDEDVRMPKIILCQNQIIPGETLYVRVWTYNQSAFGTMTLCVYEDGECAIPPVNDECNTAITLPVNPAGTCPGTGLVYTDKYATKSGDAASCQGGNIFDVWFKFNTASYGDLKITLTRLTAANLKAQILFACGDFEVACWNPADGPHVLSGLNPSADYILRIFSDSLSWGTFNVCVEDLCSDPTATMNGIQTICRGDSIFVPVHFTGTPPWTFQYTNGSTTSSFTTSSSPYFFSVAPQNTTTYTPVSIHDNTCFGTVSGSTQVNVINKPQITSFTPTIGQAGTQVTIRGLQLSGVVSVRFNNISTSGITVVNDTTILANVPVGATTGPVYLTNISCSVQSAGIFTIGSPTFTLSVKLFVEGMYAGSGTMNQPTDEFGNPVKDSVEVSLYSATSPFDFVIGKRVGLSITGGAVAVFPGNIAPGSYYIALKHRNTIETWSKNPVSLTGANKFFDFTVPAP